MYMYQVETHDRSRYLDLPPLWEAEKI
eukprot:COSAG02_NODE_2847_length_7905_cov_3.444017_10_plen_26_part_01